MLALGVSSIAAATAQPINQSSPSVSQDSKVDADAVDGYINMDIEAARAEDPAKFDKNMEILNASEHVDEFLQNNSVDPEGEKERLAAIASEEGITDFVVHLDKEYPESGTSNGGAVNTKAKCWKSWVGIGAYAMVTGAGCAATGPVVGAACTIGAAGAGDNIDWDQYC